MSWITWREHFEHYAARPLPAQEGSSGVPEELREALLASLVVFQIGEAGEGRVAREIDRVTYRSVDDDYRQALKLFVAEEGRHALILGNLIRSLGGELLEETWTEKLFVHGRRLAGVRMKILVMLAAEVVGMTFYEALAARLEPGYVKAALEEIAADETHHLAFHADFFAAEADSPGRRRLFSALWHSVAFAACATVLIDHRRTLDAFGISPRELMGRMSARIQATTAMVLERAAAPELLVA